MRNNYTSLIRSLLLTVPKPALPIFIIESKVVMPAMRLGLVFQRYIYAAVAVTLIFQVFFLKSDSSTTTCLDREYNITFIHRAWLLHQLFKQKIKEMSSPLKVKEIKILKHKFAQFAEVFLFLLDTNVEN